MLSLLGDVYSACYGFVNAMLIRLEYPAVTCLAYLTFELLLPRTRNSLQSYVRGGLFVVCGIAVNTLVLTILQELSGVSQVAAGTTVSGQPASLVTLDLARFTTSDNLAIRVAGWAAAPFGVAVIADFFYYWTHRAQHTFAWLWRFHRVHHSVTEMSAINSYHHVTEDFFQYVGVTLPLAFLLGVAAGPVPWLLIVLFNTHTYFTHSSTRINIGPLRYVFTDNRLHRIHHSRELRHMNRNFGTTTPLWDVLFGTAYFPRADEWPQVGLVDVQEPQTLRDYLMLPFRSDAEVAPQPGLRPATRLSTPGTKG